MTNAARMKAKREPRTRLARGAEDIYERIKSMAVTFAIRPDARVNEVELSKALNRLLVEGFLTRAPNKGFIGRSLDARQIYDLYELRRALETSIVRIACERASDEDLAGLEEFVTASIKRRERADTVELLALDERFHERIAELTRNREMVSALKAINARIHFVRWLDMKRRYTQQDHLKIVRALRARDVATAVTLVEEHISRRLDQIVEVIRLGFAEIYTRDQAAVK